MGRYVIYDPVKDDYLAPRGSYWERRDRADQNAGDATKWTIDLQKARVFSTRSAASNADVGHRNSHPGRILIKEVQLSLVPGTA